MKFRHLLLIDLPLLLFGVGLYGTAVLVTPQDCHSRHACPPRDVAYACGDLGDCSACPDGRYCFERKARKVALPVTGASPVSSATSSVFGVALRTKFSGCEAHDGLPEPACTPGAVLRVDAKAVCKKGYSSSVRAVSQKTKDEVYRSYGILKHKAGEYEVDHFISLELGGSNDSANLWPEAAGPAPGFREKDKVENWLHKQVCAGAITLPYAQQLISTDWRKVFQSLPVPIKKAAAPCFGGCS